MDYLQVLAFKPSLNTIKDFPRPSLKNVTLITSSLGVGFFIYKTVQIYLVRRQYRHIPGAPTKGIIGFYCGHLREVTRAFKDGEIMDNLFIEWREKYGDVFKVQFFTDMLVVTSDKNAFKEVMIDKIFPKPIEAIKMTGFPFGERFMGTSILTEVDYEEWKNRRAIFNPGFHRHVLITFVGQFDQIINTLSNKLRTKADGKTVINFFNEISRATLDAIALIAFGLHVESISSEDSKLNVSLGKILKTMQKMFVNPFMRLIPLYFNEISEFKTLVREIRQLGRDTLMNRIRMFKNNEHLPDDILTAILNNFKGESFDIEKMTDDFITFFVAGQETTANALSFCFLELGKNPDIVRKAREEIDRVLGNRTELTFSDINELKYCLAIFKEALRLFPPIVNVIRENQEKFMIGGYEIPKKTFIVFSTFMNARNEDNFESPLEFRPERFLKKADGESKVVYTYFPFGYGPRNCIGQNFAQIEGVMVIAKLLQVFDFTLDPTQSFALAQALTLRPKDGTRCFFTLRS